MRCRSIALHPRNPDCVILRFPRTFATLPYLPRLLRWMMVVLKVRQKNHEFVQILVTTPKQWSSSRLSRSDHPQTPCRSCLDGLKADHHQAVSLCRLRVRHLSVPRECSPQTQSQERQILPGSRHQLQSQLRCPQPALQVPTQQLRRPFLSLAVEPVVVSCASRQPS